MIVYLEMFSSESSVHTYKYYTLYIHTTTSNSKWSATKCVPCPEYMDEALPSKLYYYQKTRIYSNSTKQHFYSLYWTLSLQVKQTKSASAGEPFTQLVKPPGTNTPQQHPPFQNKSKDGVIESPQIVRKDSSWPDLILAAIFNTLLVPLS